MIVEVVAVVPVVAVVAILEEFRGGCGSDDNCSSAVI